MINMIKALHENEALFFVCFADLSLCALWLFFLPQKMNKEQETKELNFGCSREPQLILCSF
jgi:hypothetical protein